MAIVAGMSARSVMLAVRRWTALWRLVGWSRMGVVYLVVVEVLHVLSMMPSLPPQLVRARGVAVRSAVAADD